MSFRSGYAKSGKRRLYYSREFSHLDCWQLYSGQPLFAHVELIKEKRLHLFTDVCSDKLLRIWEEPCIVFCSHWSLRLGPAVHLLRRWSRDPHSLLVMESGVDVELAFLPFKPMAIKVLQCSFLSGMRLQKIEPLLRLLQPKLVLVPQHLAQRSEFSTTDSTTFIHYSENRTVQIRNLCPGSSELDIATDLAFLHLDWMELKHKNMNVAKLKGDIVVEHKKHLLLHGNDEVNPPQSRRYSLQWGSIDLQNLVITLGKMGIDASLEQRMVSTDDSEEHRVVGTDDSEEHRVVGADGSEEHTTVRILGPNKALIEIQGTSTVISAADENLASLIFEAICKNLNGI